MKPTLEVSLAIPLMIDVEKLANLLPGSTFIICDDNDTKGHYDCILNLESADDRSQILAFKEKTLLGYKKITSDYTVTELEAILAILPPEVLTTLMAALQNNDVLAVADNSPQQGAKPLEAASPANFPPTALHIKELFQQIQAIIEHSSELTKSISLTTASRSKNDRHFLLSKSKSDHTSIPEKQDEAVTSTEKIFKKPS